MGKAVCAKKVEKILPEKEHGSAAWWLLVVLALVVLLPGLLLFGEQSIKRQKLERVEERLAFRVNREVEKEIAKEEAEKARQEREKIRQERLKTSKVVALTFDDGPSSETERLLNILSEKGVKATFFVIGNKARNLPNVVQRELQEGHTVGSHTTSHVNFNRVRSAAEVQAEMAAMRQIFIEVTGEEPQLLRPPYGNGIYRDIVRRNVGMPMIHWSVDTLDWKNRDAGAVQAAVFAAVYDGAIILMHDVYGSTVDAVPEIIDELREQGYEFATIPELAALRGVELLPGETYFYFKP